jgi:hypothetical protein
MTEDQAIELARAAATRTADWPYHEYQPTPEKARETPNVELTGRQRPHGATEA